MRREFGLQSDESLLETLIGAAMNKGECQAIEVMATRLNQQFPEETEVYFSDLIKMTQSIGSLIRKDLLNLCKAEILQRMKRGQIMA